MEVHQQHYTRRSTSLCTTAAASFFSQAAADDPKLTSSSPPHRLSLQSHYDHHHDNLLYSPPHHQGSSSPWVSHPTPSPSVLYHCVAALHRHHGLVLSVSPSPSSGLVFTGSDSPRVRAWLHPHLCELGHLSSRHGGVRSLLSHGTTLFTSHSDLRVRVWDFSHSHTFRAKKTATLPKPRRSIFSFSNASSFSRHRDQISCMAYNPTEGLLYTASWDRTVKAWRISDGRCVDSFRAHDDRVNAVAVDNDDGCVFTCSSDGSVKVWRRVYGQSSHTLTVTLRM
ncbi:Transducin/WD40 repeat-like superfamily protein [Striga hermonthica]|uniref:Transducin/WD40 repeat-like superfamily protein n=1 Tax=Striga hermonthica TaxID=68872 RepID=A0A9N7RN02_STRHE|nr:Transducin/WD40 repeat-like superfamily protein [Striga hermonthica]